MSQLPVENDIHAREGAVKSPHTTTAYVDLPEWDTTPRYGNSFIGPERKLVLYVEGYAEPVMVPLGKSLVLGRPDPKEGQVDLDLQPFQAREKGVSRQHALISFEFDMVKVMDLSSANGTYLNGVRMLPYQPRLLRDGDELSLGKLALRVSFV